MLKLQIPKNRISALARHLRDHFALEQLEEGWEDFHKGRVSGVELRHGLEVHALVQDAETREVILRLDSIPKSECSCSGVGAVCRHIAALALTLYVPHGRPELMLAQLKQAILVKQRQQQTKQGTTKTAEKKQQERLEPPAPRKSPLEWQRFFDQQFHGFSLNQQHSIEMFHSAVKEKLSPYGEKWPSPLKELYQLHVLLFVMRKIEQFYVETKTSYLSYYIESGCLSVGRQCQEELAQLVPRLDTGLLTTKHAAPWKETLALVTDAALSGRESPLSWPTVYRSIWWRMPAGPWTEEEQTRLRRLLDTPELTPRRRDALLMAEAHFDVIRGEDEAARHRMEQISKREAKDFFLYLHHCYERQEWNRMLAWLRWLLPVVQRSQQEELRQFCHYWMEAVQQQSDDTEWVEVMVRLLPRTYQFYTTYLLKAKRYRAWIDLQMSNRVSPQSLYSADLLKVEKQDPALVLPLYHQAVERCIAEKNRTAYASATELLKKLHLFYTKLGRLSEWDDYIYRLAAKYSRLRALQEELREGKWIP